MRKRYWLRFLLGITVAWSALIIGCSRELSQEKTTADERLDRQIGLVERIRKDRVLRVGYGVYPPYTLEDPNTGKVSGFSAAIIEEIARQLGCKVQWHRLSWDTMSADLKRGVYDVIADPIFFTIPRSTEFAFSEPYAQFADGIAVVRADEIRFKRFEDLDQPGIRISVGLGKGSETLVRARFTKATIEPVAVGTDEMLVFAAILTGRADVTVADANNAKRFVAEHPEKAKALWLDNPPAFLPAGFALRPGDLEGAEFLTVCIRNLRSTGVLQSLATRYGAEAVLEATKRP
jgi:ABC-type amino acid transport substrate-binding protein